MPETYVPSVLAPTKYRIISGRRVCLPDNFWHYWGKGLSIRRAKTWQEAMDVIASKIRETSGKLGGEFHD